MHSILVVAAKQAVAATLIDVQTTTSGDENINPILAGIPKSLEEPLPAGIPMNLVEHDERPFARFVRPVLVDKGKRLMGKS